MRLLFVIDNLSTGGAQRQMITLALELKRRGHEVDFFCYMPGDLMQKPLLDAGISIIHHLKHSRFSPDVVRALRACLLSNRYDVVLSYLSTPNVYAILAVRLAGHFARIVISERSVDLPGSTTFVERLARWSYFAADHIVFNSQHQRENFGRIFPRLRSLSSTIYNGIDLDVFRPASPQPANDPLRILVVARVSHLKNGLCLIRALDILHREFNLRPVVDWAGERILQGGPFAYLQQMEKEIAQFNLSSQWNWLGQRTDLVAQYYFHDVLVHPSYGEGLPNVVCEALACGRPVILSRTLDHPFLVQEGQSGFLFDWNDPADLARQIAAFHSLSPEERHQMGQNGRIFVENNLSVGLLTDRYESLFSSLV